MVRNAWQANQHIVWEIEWPAAPIGGPLTVETWRTDERYRYEILEATAPALIGQTLVFNGQTAWQFNRFDPDPPPVLVSPALSPVSDVFAIIDTFVSTQPLTVTQAEDRLSHGPVRTIILTFENNESLTFWIDQETGLPGRIVFSREDDEATLQARSLEPLPDPPAGLFEPDR
jgi:outer membrane lipoprotein-sorting protein